jgi:hypothetical protein
VPLESSQQIELSTSSRSTSRKKSKFPNNGREN